MTNQMVDPGSDAAPPRLGRPPRAVLGCTGLFVLLLGVFSVAMPLFQAPDEYAHYDLSVAMADGQPYPDYDARHVSTGVARAVQPYLVGASGHGGPHLLAAGAPPKRDRPSLTDLGGPKPAPRTGINQLAQHPPLYYQLMGLALRLERAVVPGSGLPAVSTEVAWLRFVNLLLTASLPLAAWAFIRRLGGTADAATTAAAACLLVPQLTHIGSAINNDNLLVLLAAWLAVLLAGVARGDLSLRTAAGVAVLQGLALLTKGFAFCLLPGIVLAYGLAVRRRRAWRPAAAAGAVALGGGAVISAWFWLGNLARHGKLSPTIGADRRAKLPPRPGFDPDQLWFLRRFGAFFTERFWGWFGLYGARLPLGLVIVAMAALVVAVATALVTTGTTDRTAPTGERPARGGPRVADLLVALVPVAVLAAYVLRYAHSLYVKTAGTPFIQGRYLFAGIVPLLGVAAIGIDRLARRGAVVLTVAAGLVMHAAALHTVLTKFWAPPGASVGAQVRAMVAWSAYPSTVLAILTTLGALAAIASLLLILRAPTPPSPSSADGS